MLGDDNKLKEEYIDNNDMSSYNTNFNDIAIQFNLSETDNHINLNDNINNNILKKRRKSFEFLINILKSKMREEFFTVLSINNMSKDELYQIQSLCFTYHYFLDIMCFGVSKEDILELVRIKRPKFKLTTYRTRIPSYRKHGWTDDYLFRRKHHPKITVKKAIRVLFHKDYIYKPYYKYIQPKDYNKYNNIKIIGNIKEKPHSRKINNQLLLLEALEDIGGFKDDTLYIFLNDNTIILEPYEEYKDKPNVIFLDLRRNYRGQSYNEEDYLYFTFNNKEYIISNMYIPNTEEFMYKYSLKYYSQDNIPIFKKEFIKWSADKEIYMIEYQQTTENHRCKLDDNIYNLNMSDSHYAPLKILELNKFDGHIEHTFDNNQYFDMPSVFAVIDLDINEIDSLESREFIESIQETGNVKLYNTVLDMLSSKDSFTYTMNNYVFINRDNHSRNPNAKPIPVTLVLDKFDNYNIILRGYNDILDIGQTYKSINPLADDINITSYTNIYIKYDGITCFVSYDNTLNTLLFATKDGFDSDNTFKFRDMFMELYGEYIEDIANYLKIYNRTIVFEMIDVDRHENVITHDENRLILLDMIDNKLEFKSLNYDKLYNFALLYDMEIKEPICTDASQTDMRWVAKDVEMIEYLSIYGTPIEGVMIVNSNGSGMFKRDSGYVNFWKDIWKATPEYFIHQTNSYLDDNSKSNYTIRNYKGYLRFLGRGLTKAERREVDLGSLVDMRKNFYQRVKDVSKTTYLGKYYSRENAKEAMEESSSYEHYEKE